MSVDVRCRREIAQLHQFFADWFNGELEQSEDAFDRAAAVLTAEFALVRRDGSVTDREELLEGLWEAWATRSGEDDEIDITVDKVRVRHSEDGLHLATYIERQRVGTDANDRRSSVWFRECDGAPTGLEWLHVHETAIPT
jgi:hypothetical protein